MESVPGGEAGDDLDKVKKVAEEVGKKALTYVFRA